MPSGAIKQDDRVSTVRDDAGYFVEMRLHGHGVGEGHGDRRADAARGTDGTEQIGTLIALIGRLARSGSAPCPLANNPVLLPYPGFILKPEFDAFSLGQMAGMGAQRRREVFLNAAITSSSWPGCLGRALIWEKPRSFRSLPIVRS